MEKIWAHSGDSHFLEPDDLWKQILPPDQARVHVPCSLIRRCVAAADDLDTFALLGV